jgi:anti-anti-sigma regulatory factor
MVVVLPRELTIAQAAALQAALRPALEEGAEVLLDGTAVDEVDVAGLQVLCAAGRTALERGAHLAFASRGCSRPLADAIALAGLGHDEADRWLIREVDRG